MFSIFRRFLLFGSGGGVPPTPDPRLSYAAPRIITVYGANVSEPETHERSADSSYFLWLDFGICGPIFGTDDVSKVSGGSVTCDVGGLTISPHVVSGNNVGARISGGAAGTTYRVKFKATNNRGDSVSVPLLVDTQD